MESYELAELGLECLTKTADPKVLPCGGHQTGIPLEFGCKARSVADNSTSTAELKPDTRLLRLGFIEHVGVPSSR